MISHTYFPVLGGTEIEMQRIGSELIRRGHRVMVLCAGGGPMPPRGKWVDPKGIDVRILTSQSQGTGPAIQFSLGVLWHLIRYWRQFQIAYFLMPGLHLVGGLPLARLLGYRVFMKFSGSNEIPLLTLSPAGRWELHCLRRLRIPLMLLNDGMVEEAASVGIPREQTLFMPNPVDVETFSPATPEQRAALRRELKLADEEFVAIYTGRLSSEKGLMDLLDGFAKAATEPGLRLVLLGDGPYRGELEARVAAQPELARSVTFAGRVPPEMVPLWLQAADAFALVSPSEGFSCALSEAMAAGLPSVVSDIPANAQLVSNDVHGITVGVGDHEAIAKGFLRLSHDAAARQRMGNAAREEIVRHYSLGCVVDVYEKLFRGER
ncbi:MAG: glycosyltransferase family 4 protein [Bryobacterales bacterium]|nr:glycosyltransferase family 4 protein [Bryobacterales bacterium]